MPGLQKISVTSTLFIQKDTGLFQIIFLTTIDTKILIMERKLSGVNN